MVEKISPLPNDIKSPSDTKDEGIIKKKKVGGRKKIETPSPIDVHVGKRVRLRRTMMGMSQEKLGDALGLTFQQVQKYERGANRIGASRLFDVANSLDVPVSYFFEEIAYAQGGAIPEQTPAQYGGFAENGQQAAYESDPMAKRETLELVRAYYRITDPLQRKKLYELAKAMGGDETSDNDKK
ncbi:MAG: helix-turn-helix domain-containing protein [Alphaproteobacteria bacterium]